MRMNFGYVHFINSLIQVDNLRKQVDLQMGESKCQFDSVKRNSKKQPDGNKLKTRDEQGQRYMHIHSYKNNLRYKRITDKIEM